MDSEEEHADSVEVMKPPFQVRQRVSGVEGKVCVRLNLHLTSDANDGCRSVQLEASFRYTVLPLFTSAQHQQPEEHMLSQLRMPACKHLSSSHTSELCLAVSGLMHGMLLECCRVCKDDHSCCISCACFLSNSRQSLLSRQHYNRDNLVSMSQIVRLLGC